jgi:hypothetical protein
MGTRLPTALALLLAVSGCATQRSATVPVEIACPQRGLVQVVRDDHHAPTRREVDRNRDGRADELLFLEGNRVERAELDVDFDGATDVWLRFDGQGRPLEWEALPAASDVSAPAAVSSGKLPEDRPPPSVARLIPGLDPPLDPECLEKPEVRVYLRDVRQRLNGSWVTPARARNSHATLRFTLDPSGAVVGACVTETDDAEVARSVFRAITDAKPFPPIPDAALCLARHPLLGTFGLEQH